MDFLVNNAATILISLALLGIVAAIVYRMVKKVRRGQCISCEGCANAGNCHYSSDPKARH